MDNTYYIMHSITLYYIIINCIRRVHTCHKYRNDNDTTNIFGYSDSERQSVHYISKCLTQSHQMSIPCDISRQIVTVHARGPVVDLKLAQTYVPGLYCLLRSSIVILFMTRSNVSEDMPMLMVMSIFVYIDRTIRNESIFDSNAITMSILFSHMFNLLRVREVPVETAFVDTNGLTRLGTAIQSIYCAMSALLISDYNIGHIFSNKQSLEKKDNAVYHLFIHAMLMCTIVFIHINPSSMNQIQTNCRSFAFTCLSILWSYTVGVKNTVCALHMKEYCKVCKIPFFGVLGKFQPSF
jgi:hypothetical protein